VREQHDELKKKIANSNYPVIIHAAGGVGKSVFCRQLVNSLDDDSLGIAYDCFGAGGYRNRSESRHRHRDALVQIVNELSAKGLCNPLLVQNSTLDNDILRKFLLEIDNSVKSLRKTVVKAQLFILIDAADNAEMAAKEFNQPCFANELLREKIPDGCKLVLLCRTERISLLQPQSRILQLELNPFSATETLFNLRKRFDDATEQDGEEFHRLTGANPRVQANALDIGYQSIGEVLSSLGPAGRTVETQIESQLNDAISSIKDNLTLDFQKQINAICLGLASLPPHIPLTILSKTANVKVEDIKSFISDIGRSLWLSDTSVQFRDEPTETWFRTTFLATKGDFENYIKILEPLAQEITYVAEVLPQLYLQAEQYEKLIDIALSDDFLPENNPIDARNVRISRLQFAFKAALKSKHYNHAIKLAMRAGEEVAGNQRQLALFQTNIDLLSLLQSKEKVQEIAFKRLLSAKWDGSENVYAASLLSGIPEYHGEARGYLRASMNWLGIYFDEQKKVKNTNHENAVEDRDILELAYATLNIHGVKSCLDFFLGLKPKAAIFRIVQDLTKRLVDIGRYKEIEELLQNCTREPYYTVAITSQLILVGRFPEVSVVETCLELLSNKHYRIKRSYYPHNERIDVAIISFLEVCLNRKLSPFKILRVLRHYFPIKASRIVSDSHQSQDRTLFLRALAVRVILEGKSEVDINEILPVEFKIEKKNSKIDNQITEFKEVINGLFPWFLLYVQILNGKDVDLIKDADLANKLSIKARGNRYREYDSLPNEIADICTSILILYDQGSQDVINLFYEKYLQNNSAFRLLDRINTVRAACRLSHLSCIKQQIELSTYDLVKEKNDNGPEEIADNYISLARATLIESVDDASAYFEDAINIVSKFGDEIVQRWDAIVSISKRASDSKAVSNELAYRFIRCAELVGENVSREKYWNRGEAISVCTKLHPGSGISALSRWRDRDIGRFELEFDDIIIELVSSKHITPSIGWSLNRFLSNHNLDYLLTICLENESSDDAKRLIFNDAVHLLQVEGTSKDNWERLKNIANKFDLNNESLNTIIDFYSKEKTTLTNKSHNTSSDKLIDSWTEKWDEIFDGLTLTDIKSLDILIERFKFSISKDEYHWRLRDLLKESLNRLDEKYLWDYIDVLLTSEVITRYDVQNIFCSFPQKWMNRVSFKKKWPNILSCFGKRYAYELADPYAFKYLVSELHIDRPLIQKLKEGILLGLSEGYEFGNASIFFGFVSLASSFIEPLKAIELVDYSLSRFELHIDTDFGDGAWSDWLQVSDNINNNIAGFIWSALGSPRSSVRWNAAHCIRKLANLNCVGILDSLIDWLKRDKVAAFGSNRFPFYNLHARQYLLIALSRISIENPKLLLKYKAVFSKYALSEPHILIQKFASDIAFHIENAFPDTYDQNMLTSILSVGKSKMDILEKDYNYITNSYWHNSNEVATDLNYHFGWDFDRYWYKPLGDVFGVPEKQIEDLAANVIIKEWGLTNSSDYNNDPRTVLWNSSSHDRETWHDHGSYPRADNLDFYLSYHSMFVVAAKLIEKMPIISRRDWSENEWNEWLSRHLLTREDGKWVADCKDPLPLERPQWISDEKNDKWQSNIKDEDFLSCLKTDRNKEIWININGGWQEKQADKTETFSISSALVSKKTSDALLRALATCKDPNDYKLPDYKEDDMEIESGNFILKGWINERSISKRLDEYDPYANQIEYPPYSLGDTIKDNLNLTEDSDSKCWFTNNPKKISLICETWSSYINRKDEEPDQYGMRLKASLSFLKRLCETLNSDLIFDVGINRDISHRYDNDRTEYSKPKHKIFILSSDGNLRTTDTNHQLG